MLEARRKEIGGVTYEVTQLPFAQARKVLVLLSKKVVPGLSMALAGVVSATAREGADGVAQTAVSDIAAGAARLVQDLDEPDLIALEDAFGPCTKLILPDGKTPILTAPNRAEHFKGGSLYSYFAWLAFAIEVNYADFFDAAAPLLGAGLRGAPSNT
jgi:hypothetical protein